MKSKYTFKRITKIIFGIFGTYIFFIHGNFRATGVWEYNLFQFDIIKRFSLYSLIIIIFLIIKKRFPIIMYGQRWKREKELVDQNEKHSNKA